MMRVTRYGLLKLPKVTGGIVLAGLLALSMQTSANDGGIVMGGSPRLLKGHPTVTMTSELIKVTVTDDETEHGNVNVDCRFVFTNHGPACTVRMGFPDQGEGAYDPDEDAAEAAGEKQVLKTPPKTTFTSFRSYVDGKECKTQLIRADEEGKYWHTKMVTFPAHSVLHIRDVYTQRISGGLANMGGDGTAAAAQVAYILHTGASWHGNIGRTEVDVTFHCKQITGPLHPLPLKQIALMHKGIIMPDGREVKVKSFPPNSVVWTGPCAPKAEGKTLRFLIENWHPKPVDDIQLTYGYKTGL